MTNALQKLDETARSIVEIHDSPTKELAISLIGAAQLALQQAMALSNPQDRIEAAKTIADQLGSIEAYFKKQGADLVAGNLIDEQRIRTLGRMGLEYDNLPKDSGGNRESKRVAQHVLTPKEEAQRRTGLDHGKFSRCLTIGEHLAELEQWFPEVREKIEQSFARAIRWLRQFMPETETPALPEGKYRTIVIDPPWPIDKIERTEAGADSFSAAAYAAQGKSIGYPVMSVERLLALPVGSLADDDCHLYLWTTQRYLPSACEIVASEGWAFSYSCVMVWHKPGGFTPFFPGWMYNAEFVIFAHKGGKAIEQPGIKLCFEAAQMGHSIKPQDFYELVERASRPPRLEMFARKPRIGWKVWGNEV